jgi:hypothetical protein
MHMQYVVIIIILVIETCSYESQDVLIISVAILLALSLVPVFEMKCQLWNAVSVQSFQTTSTDFLVYSWYVVLDKVNLSVCLSVWGGPESLGIFVLSP